MTATTMARTVFTKKNPLVPEAVKVVSVKQQSPENVLLRLKKRMRFVPGQFVQVGLLGYGECPITPCSFTDEAVELNIRSVGRVTNALGELKKGDTVFLRGPYGNGYPVKELEGKTVVVVGGGCGVAPLKSLIEFVEQKPRRFRGLKLFLGYTTPQDILFPKEIEAWKKRHDVNLTIDHNPAATCFDGKIGFVTQALEESKVRGKNSVAAVCGPPVMMKTAVTILLERGFRKKDIYLSTERLMYCAVGRCCHCMIRGKFTCLDGPVFRYSDLEGIQDEH